MAASEGITRLLSSHCKMLCGRGSPPHPNVGDAASYRINRRLSLSWYTPFGNQLLYNTQGSKTLWRRRPMTTSAPLSPDKETFVISKGRICISLWGFPMGFLLKVCKSLGFHRVLQGFPSGFPVKVWVSLTFCRGFPRVSF